MACRLLAERGASRPGREWAGMDARRPRPRSFWGERMRASRSLSSRAIGAGRSTTVPTRTCRSPATALVHRSSVPENRQALSPRATTST